MWWRSLGFLAAVGCGRIDFDPLNNPPGSDPRLAAIQLVSGGQPLGEPMTPTFDPDTLAYQVDVGLTLQDVQIIAAPIEPTTTITIDTTTVPSNTPSGAIALALGPTEIAIVGTAPGGATASYAVTVTRAGMLAQGAYLKASNTGLFDDFGVSVSLDGDTLAVGADNEGSRATGVGGDQADDSATHSGAVYIFRRTGPIWAHEAYVKASNTDALDGFGSSVSLSGDTLAVGAFGESSAATGIGGNQADNSASSSGAVYVFTRTGTTWSQQAYLKASNTGAGDSFGFSVSLSGNTLVVGAYREASNATGIDGNQTDNSATESGAVYVFTRTGTTWAQQAYVKASNTDADDVFGYSVSVSGDTLAVGALYESSAATGIGGNQADNSASSSGAVYVFTRTGTTWSQQAYLKASNTDVNDHFGDVVSLSGDTLAVSACGEASAATGVDGNQADNSAMVAGAVYAFTRTGTTWSQQAYLKASNTGANDNFGHSLALSGDVLVVGSIYEASAASGIDGNQADNSANLSGAAYLFTRTGATWSQNAYLKASNAETGDTFGCSTAVSADTFVVGACEEASAATGVDGNQADDSAPASGAVYEFQ